MVQQKVTNEQREKMKDNTQLKGVHKEKRLE